MATNSVWRGRWCNAWHFSKKSSAFLSHWLSSPTKLLPRSSQMLLSTRNGIFQPSSPTRMSSFTYLSDYSFISIRNQTQDLVRPRQALCHWATSLVSYHLKMKARGRIRKAKDQAKYCMGEWIMNTWNNEWMSSHLALTILWHFTTCALTPKSHLFKWYAAFKE